MLIGVIGCSNNDYVRSNHSYQDPLPDYWESYYSDRSYYNNLDRIERKYKKRLERIEKEYTISKKKTNELSRLNLEYEEKSKEMTDLFNRKNQEIRVKRKKN